LSRGDYLSIVAGLSFFQIYSILDGCDGEIARAKYLESVRGRQLDTWCDVLGNLFMALALGYGLSRQPAFGSFYLAEGSVVATLIATNEMILGLSRTNADRKLTAYIGDAVYPRHQQTVKQSGLLFFGERFAWWLIQLTKRDVAILAFLFLALAGQPGWILHLLGAVAAISSLLTVKARLR
jgi:phosphatidylglycerophosphate synthase